MEYSEQSVDPWTYYHILKLDMMDATRRQILEELYVYSKSIVFQRGLALHLAVGIFGQW